MSLEIGSIVEGTVVRLTPYGVFVELPDNQVGLIHISEIANAYVRDVGDYFEIGDVVRAKVVSPGTRDRIELSIKRGIGEGGIEEPKLLPGREPPPRPERPLPRPGGGPSRGASQSFEERLSSFMKKSEERLVDYRRSRDVQRRKRKR